MPSVLNPFAEDVDVERSKKEEERLQEELGTLEARLPSLREDIDSLQQTIDDVHVEGQGLINALQAVIGKQTELSEVSTQIIAVLTQIAAVNKQIDAVNKQIDASTVATLKGELISSQLTLDVNLNMSLRSIPQVGAETSDSDARTPSGERVSAGFCLKPFSCLSVESVNYVPQT